MKSKVSTVASIKPVSRCQGPPPRVWQALVSRANIWLRQQGELQAVLGCRPGQDGAGHQEGDDDGRGRVQVQGGLQELAHQEHEAQPHGGR